MKNRLLPLLIIVGALAALAGTISYAVARATDGGNNDGSMMNGGGYTMMGANGHRTAWYANGSGPVADIASARAQAQMFAGRLGLRTGEVMQFASNFYVLLTDSQGKPATEVLVNAGSGAVTLEYGPAMMWNTRFGMMRSTGIAGYGGMMGGASSGGMMGGRGAGMDGMMGRNGGSPNWTPPSDSVSAPLTVTRAQRVANRWLTDQGNGLTASQPDALPGYFTFHTLKHGKISGMLSVNEQTGAVWYHWWHGRFVAMAE